jgi:hypothetical protein
MLLLSVGLRNWFLCCLYTATTMAIVLNGMAGKRWIKAVALKIFYIYTYRFCHYTANTGR